MKFGQIPIAKGELLPADALDGEPADHNRMTEASGNEGATYERSYHRAALVIWPANRMMDVVMQGGVVSALPYLKRLAGEGKSARPEALAVAQRIVDAWRTDARRPYSYELGDSSPASVDRATLISVLTKLKAADLVERFIREVAAPAYDGSENVVLLASVGVLGVARAAAVLSALVAARMPVRPGACAELLLGVAENPEPSFRSVAEAAVAGLDGIGKSPAKDTFVPWAELEDRRKRKLAPEFIEKLFAGLRHFDGGKLCDGAAEKIASLPEVFDVDAGYSGD